jgi:hypothetical protein
MTTLTVEDGTGLANANSYVSLADATEYHVARGNSDWTGTDDDLSAALALAWDSLHLLYGQNFKGTLLPTTKQAGLFPRLPFTDNNGRLVLSGQIPACVIQAQCEIALLYVQGNEIFPIKNEAQNVAEQSAKLGDLATTTRYFKPVEGEMFPGFRKVDLVISPVLNKKAQAYRIGL